MSKSINYGKIYPGIACITGLAALIRFNVVYRRKHICETYDYAYSEHLFHAHADVDTAIAKSHRAHIHHLNGDRTARDKLIKEADKWLSRAEKRLKQAEKMVYVPVHTVDYI